MKQLYSFAKELKDKIPGGLADKKSPEDFDPKAMNKGIMAEMEHTNDRQIAEEIAMDHLVEDPMYYERLEKMENKASHKSHKELLKIIDVTREKVKKSDVYKDMCKEYGVDIDY